MLSPQSFLLLPLLLSLFSLSLCFPLSELSSGPSYAFSPRSVHALHGTSVLLVVRWARYKPSDAGLHPSVTLPDSDRFPFHVLLRVSRKSGNVAWAHAITSYVEDMHVALLSPSKVAVVGYPAFRPETPDRNLTVCVFAVSDGGSEKCVTGKLSNANVFPYIVPIDNTKILLPTRLYEMNYSSPAAVAQLDLVSGDYGESVLLRNSGKPGKHPLRPGLYGSYSSEDGTACFLTDRYAGFKEGESMYDIFVHCFEPETPSLKRSKLLASISLSQSRYTVHIAVANGQVFVSYQQSMRSARGFVSEVVIHKLSSATLDALVWIEKNRQALPRIIELPQADDEKLAVSSVRVHELTYLKRRNGVAVRVSSELNMTGRLVTRNNRIVLQSSGVNGADSPEQWVIFLGKKKRPVIRALPVASSSKQNKGIIPTEYGKMTLSDTDVSVSGRKLIAYGILKYTPPKLRNGPLFMYDIKVPYRRM